MSFLHGVETIEKQVGPVPVNTVKTAVIGVVGTSPKGEPGKMHLVQSESDFEENLGAGGTLEDALSAIWDHCNPNILAINAFDPMVHYETHEVEFYTDQYPLPADAYGIKLQTLDDSQTYSYGTNYNVNAEGLLSRIGVIAAEELSVNTFDLNPPGALLVFQLIDGQPEHLDAVYGYDQDDGLVVLAEGTDYVWESATTLRLIAIGSIKRNDNNTYTIYVSRKLKLKYYTQKLDDVAISDIVSTFSSFESALSEFGFFPKILIAPGFSQELAVGREMVAVAEKIRAMAYIDAPEGLNPTEAVQFKSTNYGDARAMFCYPKVKIWDNAQGVYRFDWLSSRFAGLRAKTDFDEGYWYSLSNHIIQGITGMERVLDYNPSEKSSELNYVNSMGVISVLNFLGSGYRSFGNRTCAFPFQSDPLNTFECWRRVGDIIEESITYFTLQFLDKPMFSRPEKAKSELILRVEESVNDFMRELKGRGALVEGFCVIKADENPVSNLANGQLAYHYEFTPAVPAERITYNAVANITALETVFAKIATA